MISNAKQIAEQLERVDITTEEREIGCGPGNMDRKLVTVYEVTPVWKGVDRKSSSSYSCSNKPQLAKRLKAAMENGDAFAYINVVKDINGCSYVSASMKIMMRSANADLKKLGY